MCWKVKLGKFKNSKFRWKPFYILLLLLNFSKNWPIKRELFVCFSVQMFGSFEKHTFFLSRNDVRFFLLQMTLFASTKRSRKSGKEIRENHNQMNVSKRFSVNSLVVLQFNVVVFFHFYKSLLCSFVSSELDFSWCFACCWCFFSSCFLESIHILSEE